MAVLQVELAETEQILAKTSQRIETMLVALRENKAKADGKAPAAAKKPHYVQYGMNHVTNLIESKKAKVVCIASDVAPLELVIWMPALCRKLEVPYCIVKNKRNICWFIYTWKYCN